MLVKTVFPDLEVHITSRKSHNYEEVPLIIDYCSFPHCRLLGQQSIEPARGCSHRLYECTENYQKELWYRICHFMMNHILIIKYLTIGFKTQFLIWIYPFVIWKFINMVFNQQKLDQSFDVLFRRSPNTSYTAHIEE